MVEVPGVPPLNVHAQEVGLFVDRSVKFTAPPAQTVVVLAEKFATGGGTARLP